MRYQSPVTSNQSWRITVSGFFLILVSGFWLLDSGYGADSAPTLKIGVVNLERIFEQYEKTRSFKARIKELSDAKQQERERIVSEIRQLREEMVLLNEEGRRERQGSYEEKMKNLAAFDRQAKESIRKEEEGALKVIQEEIEQAVDGFAKEQDFTLILVDRAVLYGVEAMDVTEEVLALLNGRHKEGKR